MLVRFLTTVAERMADYRDAQPQMKKRVRDLYRRHRARLLATRS